MSETLENEDTNNKKSKLSDDLILKMNKNKEIAMNKRMKLEQNKLLDKNDLKFDNRLNNNNINSESTCSICQSNTYPLDEQLLKPFNEYICINCKLIDSQDKQLYSLVSRKQAIDEYLLTADSLNTLDYITKDNPQNNLFKPMKLYLLLHVQNKAIKRFGSLDQVDIEKKNRNLNKFIKNQENVIESLVVKSNDNLNNLIDNNNSNKKVKRNNKKTHISELIDCIRGNSDNSNNK